MAVKELSIFRGRRVLITGHTGFKGAWLAIWLDRLGAQVTGIALDPTTSEALFTTSRIGDRLLDLRGDIRDAGLVSRLIREAQPEVIFHLAAQSLVLEGYRTPVETFDVNVMGTVNVLEAIRSLPVVRAGVMITTDKCYENHGRPQAYRETDALGGYDPYSASKGAAEIVIASYRRSFFAAPGSTAIASARSGNVIGGGDWSAHRIVPDFFRAIARNTPLVVRKPDAVRPWQHVLEPLYGYLLLAARMLGDPGHHAEAWNFGPSTSQIHTVRELVEALITRTGRGYWREAGDEAQAHEADLLLLDISKADHALGWAPRLSFAATVGLTADWYLRSASEDTHALCLEQIEHYEGLGDP